MELPPSNSCRYPIIQWRQMMLTCVLLALTSRMLSISLNGLKFYDPTSVVMPFLLTHWGYVTCPRALWHGRGYECCPLGGLALCTCAKTFIVRCLSGPSRTFVFWRTTKPLQGFTRALHVPGPSPTRVAERSTCLQQFHPITERQTFAALDLRVSGAPRGEVYLPTLE